MAGREFSSTTNRVAVKPRLQLFTRAGVITRLDFLAYRRAIDTAWNPMWLRE